VSTQRERDRGPRPRALLSIGALSRATDISVESLRTWERRYGYPVPDRKPSGHRLYPVEAVGRLRRIAEALACGHRAREVVAASDGELAVLLAAAPSPARHRRAGPARHVELDHLLDAVERFDGPRLTRPLLAEWARLAPLEFLRDRIAPLVHEVGERWATGGLEIRHEHFLSERVGDLLRTVRIPFEERATGAPAVMATLPGEAHALGLQMAALLLATHGRRICYVGTEVPIEQLATLARDLGASTVAISVSAFTQGRATARRLAQLRRALPARAELLVGGGGAPRRCGGTRVIDDLDALHAWAARR
jgi:methanogenic corrinoid protein MtbC1